MTSIFLTTRAIRNERYHQWLLDVNMACILGTGLGLNEHQVRATSTWRWFRDGIAPQDAAWILTGAYAKA